MTTWVWMDSLWIKDNNSPAILLFGRDYNDKTKTVKHKITGFRPYFYVPSEVAGGTSGVKKINGMPIRYEVDKAIYTDALGRQVRKMFTSMPSDVPKIRGLFEYTDEADILFDKRYLVDMGIRYAFVEDQEGRIVPVEVDSPITPRIAWFDIEVKGDRGNIPLPTNPVHPIVSIQIMDSYTKNITIFTHGVPQVADDQIACVSEQELLFKFASFIRDLDPDILSGWYTNGFDIPYIVNRASLLGISLKELGRAYIEPTCRRQKDSVAWFITIPGRQSFDLLDGFKKYYKPKGELAAYDLKSVIANKEVMEESAFSYVDYGDKINDLFDTRDWKTFLQYCRNDVIALDTIDTKLKLIDFYEHLRMIAGVKIEETLMNSRVIEALILHAGIKPMPTKDYTKTDTEKFEGALVLTPPLGIHEDVGVVDLAALYPNIMVGFNISPDKDGVILNTLKVIMEEREKLRRLKNEGKATSVEKNKETVLKYLANSFYGVIGWPRFRLYNRDQASKITETGRILNEYLQDIAREKGYQPIYGDSVVAGTKVSVNGIHVPIETLFTSVDYTNGDKEYCNLYGIYADTLDNNNKWCTRNVPYIMRHRCNKKIYRIHLTEYQHIDVTEDHSLFAYINKRNRSGDMCIKQVTPTTIGHSSLIQQRHISHTTYSQGFDESFYELLGYWAGDGSVAGYYKNEPYYLQLSLGEDKDELADWMASNRYILTSYPIDEDGDVKFRTNYAKYFSKDVQEWLYKESPDNICAYLRGLFSADGSVMIRNGCPIIRLSSINETLINDIQELLLHVGIASSIFRETIQNSYNGKSTGTYTHHLHIKNVKRYADTIGFLLKRKTHRLTISRNQDQFENDDYALARVMRVEEINYEGYVYDIEVEETHRFFANKVLVHNTDSIFVKGIPDTEAGLAFQDQCNEKLSEWSDNKGSTVHFSLKFEKFYKRLMFKRAVSGEVAKKRYAGYLIWKDDPRFKPELNFTGIELKRSDQSNITKTLLRGFLTDTLVNNDVETAISTVRKTVRDVLSGKVSIHDVSIPKGVKDLERNDPWARGVKNCKEILGIPISQGIKPRLIYIKGDRKELCITADMDETLIRSKVEVDWNRCMDKTIRSKMETFIESIGYSWDSVVEGQRTLI